MRLLVWAPLLNHVNAFHRIAYVFLSRQRSLAIFRMFKTLLAFSVIEEVRIIQLIGIFCSPT